MNENLRSIFLGTLPLDIAALAAVLLTLIRRGFNSDPRTQNRLTSLFLIGISLQCLHFIEESLTQFNRRFPQAAWTVALVHRFLCQFQSHLDFRLGLVCLRLPTEFAFFPIWFFIIVMIANGVAHLLLAVAAGGYFPGLWTSPLVGLIGIILGSSFWKFTA